jgi:hypothetical protein
MLPGGSVMGTVGAWGDFRARPYEKGAQIFAADIRAERLRRSGCRRSPRVIHTPQRNRHYATDKPTFSLCVRDFNPLSQHQHFPLILKHLQSQGLLLADEVIFRTVRLIAPIAARPWHAGSARRSRRRLVPAHRVPAKTKHHVLTEGERLALARHGTIPEEFEERIRAWQTEMAGQRHRLDMEGASAPRRAGAAGSF